MSRYFFDTRDDDVIMRDDLGLEFPDLERVKAQASRSLAELALDVLPGSDRRCLGVDVRDSQDNRVLMTELTFEARVLIVPFQ